MTKQLITPDELRRLMPQLSAQQAQTFAPLLASAMLEQGITTKKRRCAFLAQLAQESGQLTRWQENLNYKASRLMEIWPTRFTTIAKADLYAHRPVAIANHVYANRGGNGPEASGDGYNYRGRGPIQLTLRENYRIFGDELGLPLEKDPDLAAHTEHGFRIAALFWKRAGCNRLADKLTMKGDNYDRQVLTDITKKINGGRHGLAERINYFRIAKQVLHADDDVAQDSATQPETAAPAKSPALEQSQATQAEPDVDLLGAAVTSTSAKTAGMTGAKRLAKHSGAAVTFLAGLSEAQKLGLVFLAVLLLAGACWLVYHNRTWLKSKWRGFKALLVKVIQ